MNRDLGFFVLPQPVKEKEYVRIPKLVYYKNYLPFGYVQDDEDPHWLKPVPLELDALKLARKHVKKYSYKAVAAWLTKQTGRSITAEGLRKRINAEISARHKSSHYRRLAERIYKALKRAQEYESNLSKEDKSDFFETGYYIELDRKCVDEFGGDTVDD